MQPLPIMIFLILFPFLLALVSLIIRPLSARRAVAVPANILIAAGSVALLPLTGTDSVLFQVGSPL